MSDHAALPVAHYFGPEEQLFGIYHPCSAAAYPQNAVLLCPPMGQEQIRTHRMYRQLAGSLASQGTPCLRFNYFGSGDSAGESEQRDWHRCKADIVAAAARLRTLSGCQRIVAFGARLGASLVLETAADAGFEKGILWDPVMDVSALVERMDALQQELLGDPERFLTPRSSPTPPRQWSGFAVSERLREQMAAARPSLSSLRCLLLDSSGHEAGRSGADPRSTWITLAQPTSWEDHDRLELAILSHELIRTSCDWLKEDG